MNQNELTKFKNLYPNFDKSNICTFDDFKERKGGTLKFLTSEQNNSLRINTDKLIDLNKKAAGVFFSVNQLKDGHKRNKENISGINSWIVECDILTKKEQEELIKNAPIKPSLIIESCNSYHIYYFSKDATFEKWEEINRGLCEYYHGDSSICSDTSRTLRLPGFNHMKNPEQPFPVTIKENNGSIFTESIMIENFPYSKPLIISSNKPSSQSGCYSNNYTSNQNNNSNTDDFWPFLASLNSKMMLERISGQSFVGGEVFTFKNNKNGTYQLIVNGTETGKWIDSEGKIGGGGPTWIQWIEWYGVFSKGEIAKWVRENLKDIIPDKYYQVITNYKLTNLNKPMENKDIKAITKDDIDKVFDTNQVKSNLTFGIDKMDNMFGKPLRGEYIVLVGETGSGKTTYSLFSAIENSKKGNKVLFISLEMNKDMMIRNYMSSIADVDIENIDDINQYIKDNIYKDLGNGNLSIVDNNDDNITYIEYIETIIKKNEYDFIIIDNFGFIKSKDSKLEGTKMEDYISRKISDAVKQGTTVLINHHYSKGQIESKTHHNNAVSRGSQKIMDDCTKSISIKRKKDNNDSIFIQNKDRYGGRLYRVTLKLGDNGFESKND